MAEEHGTPKRTIMLGDLAPSVRFFCVLHSKEKFSWKFVTSFDKQRLSGTEIRGGTFRFNVLRLTTNLRWVGEKRVAKRNYSQQLLCFSFMLLFA